MSDWTLEDTRLSLRQLEDLCAAAELLLEAHRTRAATYPLATINEDAAVRQIRDVLHEADEHRR